MALPSAVRLAAGMETPPDQVGVEARLALAVCVSVVSGSVKPSTPETWSVADEFETPFSSVSACGENVSGDRVGGVLPISETL
jgi:hypothetical protein